MIARLTRWEINNTIPERGVFSSGYCWVRTGTQGSYRRMLEHRLVAEQKLGRSLLPREVVHHIDCNKQNNHPDNLEILPNNTAHMRKHGDLRKLAPRKHQLCLPKWVLPACFRERFESLFSGEQRQCKEWLDRMCLKNERHFWGICNGTHAVTRLRAIYWESTLGPKTWAYCMGESDVLTDGR